MQSTRRVCAVGTVIAMAVMLAGCGGEHASPAPGADSDPIVVRAIEAGVAESLGSWILPGRVRAREEVTLASRITGRLTALPMREGASFRRGQVLARFDAPETRDAVRSAEVRVVSARARLDQARADETRMQALFDRNVASMRDLELARVARHDAEAALSSAGAERLAWQENAALTAPFDGVVARRHVDPGQTLTPGEPILDLRSRDVGEIEVTVPESVLPLAEDSAPEFQIGDGAWRQAALARIDGMTDPETRSRRAWLRAARTEDLEAGASARVRFRGAAPVGTAPIVVPDSALVTRGSLTGVYVLREERAWLRWLRVGRQAEGRTEVLSGLTRGDRYAANPDGLSDGHPVKVAE